MCVGLARAVIQNAVAHAAVCPCLLARVVQNHIYIYTVIYGHVRRI